MAKEIEAKFIPIDKSIFRQKLLEIGAILKVSERLMRRKTFDFVGQELPKNHFKWARVRDEGDKITMTIKYLIDEKRIDNVDEAEVIVDSFDSAVHFLELAGLVEVNYQENYRETWNLNTAEITIDTWPGLDPLTEIEDETEESVKTIAQQLGLDYSKSFFGSMDIVYEFIHNIPFSGLKLIKNLTFETAESEIKRVKGIGR